MGFPCGSAGKESICNAGDLGSIPVLGWSPGKGKGYPLQYSGLENSMDCTVHGVSRSRTRLSDFYYFVIYQETPSFPVLLVRRDGSKVKNNLSLSLSLFFCFLFLFFGLTAQQVGLSFPTRDWACAPYSGSESRLVVSDSLRPHGLCIEFSRPEYWSG